MVEAPTCKRMSVGGHACGAKSIVTCIVDSCKLPLCKKHADPDGAAPPGAARRQARRVSHLGHSTRDFSFGTPSCQKTALLYNIIRQSFGRSVPKEKFPCRMSQMADATCLAPCGARPRRQAAPLRRDGPGAGAQPCIPATARMR